MGIENRRTPRPAPLRAVRVLAPDTRAPAYRAEAARQAAAVAASAREAEDQAFIDALTDADPA